MSPTTEDWYFVYDATGRRLAAFPERDLAAAYSENTGWAVRKEPLILRAPPTPVDQAAAQAWDDQREAIAESILAKRKI